VSILSSGIGDSFGVDRWWLDAARSKASDDLLWLILRLLTQLNNNAVLIGLQRFQGVQLRLEKADWHEVITSAGEKGGDLLERPGQVNERHTRLPWRSR
jgi:hypothetical protein